LDILLERSVIVFGLIFPLFLLIAFTIGRNISVEELFPGVMGMAIFFTATAVGPAILPWEARSRTLERLVCSPISVWALFLGDVLASFFFGLLISLAPLIVFLGLGVEVSHILVFAVGMILATFCFASLSILLSVYPPTDVPATVMMLSSLVRFPLVFISGVFLPVEELPTWGRAISSISPLTYFIDLARYSTTGISYYSVTVDLAVLVLFTMLFLLISIKLHERFLPQRLS
jgi:ABC-2 type transport system permease protein